MAIYFPQHTGRGYRAPVRRERPVNAANLDAYRVAHPERAAFIERKADGNEFFTSMLLAILRYGDLTERQAAAVDRNMAQEAERAAEPQAPAVDTTIDQTAIREVLRNRRKVTVAGFTFSLAGPGSRNHLAIYVKLNGEYVGKAILGGTKFQPTREFDMDLMEKLRSVFANPGDAVRADAAERAARILEAARNGDADLPVPCGCCGILLTDPVSRARGIGPICAGKYGF